MNIAQITALTSPFDHAPLECDGMTRVLHTILSKNNIPHKTKIGLVVWKDQEFSPHFWIELSDGHVIDYRLRMWFGRQAPHGIFKPQSEGVVYDGRTANLPLLNDALFYILSGRPIEAGVKEVVDKIYRRVRDFKMVQYLTEKLHRYLKTKNPDDDLTKSEVALVYGQEDYGDAFDMPTGKELDVDWTNHAEYRCDLRDVDPSQINEAVRNYVEKNPKKNQKVNLMSRGMGKAVVDMNTMSNPSRANVVTVIATQRTYWHGSSIRFDRFKTSDIRFALLGVGVYLYKNKQAAKRFGDIVYRVDVPGSFRIAPKDFQLDIETLEGLFNHLGISDEKTLDLDKQPSGVRSVVWWGTDGWSYYGLDRKKTVEVISLMMKNKGWHGMIADYPNGGEVCVIWKRYEDLIPIADADRVVISSSNDIKKKVLDRVAKIKSAKAKKYVHDGLLRKIDQAGDAAPAWLEKIESQFKSLKPKGLMSGFEQADFDDLWFVLTGEQASKKASDILLNPGQGNGNDDGDKTHHYMLGGTKTFYQIDEEGGKGHKHHWRKTCVECGDVNTCRCSQPKVDVSGICYYCCEKLGIDFQTGVKTDTLGSQGDCESIRKVMSANRHGDCYQAAGHYMMDHGKEDGTLLVQGEVTGQGQLEGVQFGHSWIEKGGMVLEVANGKNKIFPKELYYAIGQIQRTKKYNYHEAMKWMVKTGHFGPWELKTRL